jgi:hypothetical protein
MDYVTSRGVKFSFNGFPAGCDPLTYFDNQDYVRCLHGCMVLVDLFVPREIKHLYLEDDGLLHELVHLSLSIDICTHGSLIFLRQRIQDLINASRDQKETQQTESV